MASTRRPRSTATTEPKGRPTPGRDSGDAPRDTVALQWLGLALAIVAIVGAMVWFGRDWGGQPTHGGVGGVGAPATVTVDDPTGQLRW